MSLRPLQMLLAAPLSLVGVVVACDATASESSTDATISASTSQRTNDDEIGSEQPASPPAGQAAPSPPPRAPRKVPSGLDVGMTMASFEVLDPVDGTRRCQVCEIGPAPKLVAVGLPDDPAFVEDVRDLQALLAKYGDQAPQAFVVLAEAREGSLLAPEDPAPLLEEARSWPAKARVGLPVVVAATDDEPDPFAEHYRITASRTLMLADGENVVAWSETAPAHLGKLDLALAELTGQTHPRPGATGEAQGEDQDAAKAAE